MILLFLFPFLFLLFRFNGMKVRETQIPRDFHHLEISPLHLKNRVLPHVPWSGFHPTGRVSYSETVKTFFFTEAALNPHA